MPHNLGLPILVLIYKRTLLLPVSGQDSPCVSTERVQVRRNLSWKGLGSRYFVLAFHSLLSFSVL